MYERQLWDLSPDQIAALETTRTPQRAMVFYSPANGHVISKRAMEGLHITAGESLYQVADLSTVWIEADVYERELPVVRVGATAGVTLDAYPGDENAPLIKTLKFLIERNAGKEIPVHGRQFRPVRRRVSGLTFRLIR